MPINPFMFVRLKKLKGNNYAYLVANNWTKKGPRQKIKKYLGRCINLEKKKEVEIGIKNIEEFVHGNGVKKILARVFEYELLKFGFKKDPLRRGFLYYNDIEAKPKTFKIYHKEQKNNIVLKINEGYLCEYLVKRILKFSKKDNEDEIENNDAIRFAELFIMAGIDIDKEIFIELFQKFN